MGVRAGVLALQGNVSEHVHALERALSIHEKGYRNEPVVRVRHARDIEKLDALVIPGGESTTISRLIDKNDLFEPLVTFGGGILATCAGMVLMANEVSDERIHPLALMDFSVERNAFGRQKESFEADIDIRGFDSPFHAIFIRAPVATRSGPGVTVLSRIEAGIVALEQGRYMAVSFHPELSQDPRLHLHFLRNLENGQA